MFAAKNTTTAPAPSSITDKGVDSFIQPKLNIGKPNDAYEVEADNAADQIIAKSNESSTSFFPTTPKIQKQSEEDVQKEETQETEIQQKPVVDPMNSGVQLKENTPVQRTEEETEIQEKCSDCEKENNPQKLQMQTSGDSTNTSSGIENSLQNSKGGGSPLPSNTKDEMESGFGTDFSGVRVHDDSTAVQMNQQLGAQAFTNGNDIYFNEGKYSPENDSGKHLLAHELTHTVQQGASNKAIQKQDDDAQTPLEELDEKLSYFNVPEDEVVDLCGQLNADQKNTVRTNRTYKSRMAGSLNASEMKRAVVHLGFTLETQLEWINASVYVTSSINYSEIKSLVTSAPVSEKNVLKTSTTAGKSFFVSVCTNTTMVEALDDLGFDLVTKLLWLKAEMTITSWELDYATIKPWITHANTSQTERDSLKTHASVGKSFFVDVCTNATMVTALDDLKFDMITKLTWLYAEITITRLELDYTTIQPWITSATQVERDSLKTHATFGKDFFVSVCTNATMVTALDDLGFDLVTKLTWLLAEVIITSWELNYSIIQPWITSATQIERDSLKTSTTIGKDFFASVCDDTTIVTALDDLKFDLLTTIQWVLAEVALNNINYTWLCAKFKVEFSLPANEEAIACAIMERDIRDRKFDTSADHRPPAWKIRAHNQRLVADEMGTMVGETAIWKPSQPGSGTTFEAWASAPTEGPVPDLRGLIVINCWEMVMLAAFRSRQLSWPAIHSIYTSRTPNWGAFLVNQLSFNNSIPYDPTVPRKTPVAGDIVFFDGAAHVALAMGTLDGAGRSKIYSFWPPPNTAFTRGGTVDDVKITTIEELNTYWVGKGKPAFNLTFSTPNWN